MRYGIFLAALLTLVALFHPASTTQAQTACADGEVLVNGTCGDASFSSLPPGWSRIEPGGETTCAHDTPYAYWVRPGTRDDLLVYFQGGGGCWNADTCRDTGEEFNGFYDSRISEA